VLETLLFLNDIPMWFPSRNMAKLLVIEVWLDIKKEKMEYIV